MSRPSEQGENKDGGAGVVAVRVEVPAGYELVLRPVVGPPPFQPTEVRLTPELLATISRPGDGSVEDQPPGVSRP